MCGIVALFSPDRPVLPEVLARATATLHHRGPDGQRQWVAPSGEVGLGHARLAIIDLQTGDQPLANEDEQIHVVVNGEFYDFERIRSELEARGHRFRTRSDSEIVLHLYEEYGAHCVHHLRGEFAFVLWDARQRRLLAVRDRFGIKPLYYADLGGTLAFASEVKALRAAGLQPRWDHETFAQMATLGTYLPDRSLFEGVRQIPPGHYLIAGARGRQLVRYWDFDYPIETAASRAADGSDDAAHVEQFRAALDEAVRLRLRADVPVGCYLSGGLDSCAVLGLAARHSSKPIRAFTLSFDQPEYDEQAIAREMAARCQAEFNSIPVTQEDLAEDFPGAVWHSEQLFGNSHGVAKYRLSRFVREQGYRVVLTGEGSDEILAGYPSFRRDMLLHDRGGQDPAVVASLLADLDRNNAISRGLLMPDGQSLPLDSVRRVLGFTPSWIEAFAGTGFKMQPLLAPEVRASHQGRDPFLGMLDTFDVRGQLRGRAPVHQSLYLWSKTMLPNYILSVLGDRMEMAHSVEGRVPFLDHLVVELACSLPVSAKIRGLTEKYVLREAVRPVITPTVYRRQKHPFLAPPAATAPDGALHELMQTTLRGTALDRVPFYDRRQVVSLLDSLPGRPPAAQAALDPTLMVMLSLAVLAERFSMA
jgi:asparagine synthase (glutamine-hydrolysing)